LELFLLATVLFTIPSSSDIRLIMYAISATNLDESLSSERIKEGARLPSKYPNEISSEMPGCTSRLGYLCGYYLGSRSSHVSRWSATQGSQCSHCQTLDFNSVFTHDFDKKSYLGKEFEIGLLSVMRGNAECCSSCRFFSELARRRIEEIIETKEPRYSLWENLRAVKCSIASRVLDKPLEGSVTQYNLEFWKIELVLRPLDRNMFQLTTVNLQTF
jgi:hypothetical protein